MKWILLVIGIAAMSYGLGTGNPLIMVNGMMCLVMSALAPKRFKRI